MGKLPHAEMHRTETKPGLPDPGRPTQFAPVFSSVNSSDIGLDEPGRKPSVQFAIDILALGAVFTAFELACGQASGLRLVLEVGLLIAVWTLVLYFRQFHRPTVLASARSRLYELAKAGFVSFVFASALFFVLGGVSFGPGRLAIGTLLGLVALATVHSVTRSLLPRSVPTRRVLVLGSGSYAGAVAEEIDRHSDLGYQMVGYVALDSDPSYSNGHPVVGTAAGLQTAAADLQADMIVVANIRQMPESVLKALGDCIDLGVEVIPAPKFSERLSSKIPILQISHAWFLNELDEGNRKLYDAAKRITDIVLACLGLVVAVPFAPFVALLIRLDSHGPILYSQVRVGKGGRLFCIYKLRTMVQDAERNGAVWASVKDDRVTRVGRVLRRLRLDEWPQFYNVLMGDMSMVGPRPERPEFVAELAGEIPFFNRRHLVLPGLTGWAQVNYRYGASVEDSQAKLEYDLFYIKNRSLFLDLDILFRTVAVVVMRIGAR